MSRSIAAVFIFVALAVQATFALIDYPRETVTLELTDEDLVQARPGTYLEPHAAVHLGNLDVGKHVVGEETYNRVITKENTHDIILLYTLNLKMNGVINFVSVHNVEDSQAVVCINENALERSEGSIVVRIAPHSVAKLNILVGMHQQ
ncbi:hypothetical protein QLX08_008017 [Tetragonisca angustula]|uniref:Uncharacterized protein n=1 Tax=Tetragonisca angustula TaxID=166442 RepID=A0AAW0ZMA5_9HYME